jgi:uncharacterized RDD family membrane protein YckC
MSTPPPERGGLVGRGLGRIVGAAVPAVIRQVDTEELLDALDVDAVVEALDVNKVAERIDLDALIDRLDVNQVAQRLDLDALIERLDLDQVADRLDLNRLIDRLDVNRVAERIDLDALVERLDVNQVAERLEITGVLDRVELVPLMSRGAEEVASSTLDLARRQVVRFDAGTSLIVDRVLRRDPEQLPLGPPTLLRVEAPITKEATSRREVTGHYAGPISRLAAYAFDSFAAVTLFGVVGSVAGFLVDLLTERGGEISLPTWLGRALFALWLLGWFWLPLAVSGRTAGKLLVGLRVVRGDGSRLGAWRALVRTIVLPLSMVLVGLGLVGIVIGRRHRALHDVVADSVEVYDWGARRAEQPVPLLASLSARARREGSDDPSPPATSAVASDS